MVPEYVCRTGPSRDSVMVEAMKKLLAVMTVVGSLGDRRGCGPHYVGAYGATGIREL